MSTISSARAALAVLVAAIAGSAAAQGDRTYGFGTPVAEGDLSRFHSSIPDGRDLPPGSGSVAQGRELYATQCASCHGPKLEGGIGDKLVGGRGTLPGNSPTKPPVKTVESYWPYATTLVDYIERAMPLNAPGSLTGDQVYALAAYILAEAHIVPDGTVLDAKRTAAIRMPNRDGFIPDPRPERFPPESSLKPISEAFPAPAEPTKGK